VVGALPPTNHCCGGTVTFTCSVAVDAAGLKRADPDRPVLGAAVARDTFVLIAIGLLILIAVIAVTVAFRS